MSLKDKWDKYSKDKNKWWHYFLPALTLLIFIAVIVILAIFVFSKR